MKHEPVQKQVYTVTEAANLLGVSQIMIYRGIRRGELPVVRLGRSVFLPRAEVNKMIGMSGTAA